MFSAGPTTIPSPGAGARGDLTVTDRETQTQTVCDCVIFRGKVCLTIEHFFGIFYRSLLSFVNVLTQRLDSGRFQIRFTLSLAFVNDFRQKKLEDDLISPIYWSSVTC